MKKRATTLLLLLLGLTYGVHAQQKKDLKSKGDEHYESMDKIIHRSAFNTRPAMIHGSVKNVVFGKEPTLEVHRVIQNNIPIFFNGQKYYFNDGDFFAYNGGRYLLIAPPKGLKIKELPKHSFRLKYGNHWLYYCNGIFYRALNDAFEVVTDPQGAIIYDLSPLADVVNIDNEAYYEYLGVIYKKVLVDNEEGFQVVGELTE